MKNLEQVENLLLNWKPRSPSENLRQRLFGQNHAPHCRLAALAIGRWLAPAMAIFILGVVYFDLRPGTWGPGAGFASVGNGLEQGINYATATPSDRNLWAVTTFDWTNTGQYLSSALPAVIKGGLAP